MQSDSHLLPDTLLTALRCPVKKRMQVLGGGERIKCLRWNVLSRYNNIFLFNKFNMHIGCSKEPSHLDDLIEYYT